MPKDTTTPAEPRKHFSLAEILADMEVAQKEPVELGALPPIYVTEEIKRSPKPTKVPDLSGLAKLWMLIGEGNTGKTVVARYMIERLIEHGRLADSMIAALAPGSRNLRDFAPGTQQPPSSDARSTADWATKYLAAIRRARWGGVWDFGGGDTALHMMIQAQPNMAERAEQDGVAIVPAYLFSPRLDDLVFLKTYEDLGFRPRATALILNLGKAAVPSSFNDLRNQPEYKAALARGAIEFWLPPLQEHVALEIERARSTFAHARDGEAAPGKKPADISLMNRVYVREWLMRMEAEFKDVERSGWMPWI